MNNDIKQCLFCNIINSKIKHFKIYENNFAYAFLDAFPLSKGHVLIISKQHFNYFSNTPLLSLSEIIKVTKIIAQKIKTTFKPLGINYLINEEEFASQKIFHTHLHIIPKYQNNDGLIFSSKNKRINTLDLESIQKKIAF